MVNQQWSISNGQSAISNDQSAMINQQWSISNDQFSMEASMIIFHFQFLCCIDHRTLTIAH
jgi:hypothetical protein